MRVAVTFDDLPFMAMPGLPGGAGRDPAPEAAAVSERIVGALAEHGAPAAVFVNTGIAAELDAVLRPWVEAGIEIGNHTAMHLDIDVVDAARWEDDVRACDADLRRRLGRPARYFRFPYLRYGATVERKAMAAAVLRGLGYEVAHVSVATADWLLAHYYEIAAHHGAQARVAEIGGVLVEHVREALAAARRMAEAAVGRDIAHVLLLHVNRLTADRLPAVLGRMRGDGCELVTLSAALADPCYSLPDRYTGPRGCAWMGRLDPALDDLVARGGYPFSRQKLEIQDRFRPVFGWPEVPFVA